MLPFQLYRDKKVVGVFVFSCAAVSSQYILKEARSLTSV
jgi:hypothetical protein